MAATAGLIHEVDRAEEGLSVGLPAEEPVRIPARSVRWHSCYVAAMNQRIQRELQKSIEAFGSDVTAVLTRAVAEAVAAALARARVEKAVGGRAAAARRPKSGRGSSYDVEKLLVEVKREGGRRMEQIAKSLRTSTKSLSLPMNKLIAAKNVKARGVARGMKYSAVK
jgi:hypothetical protein